MHLGAKRLKLKGRQLLVHTGDVNLLGENMNTVEENKSVVKR
jgi:hypothetical protein